MRSDAPEIFTRSFAVTGLQQVGDMADEMDHRERVTGPRRCWAFDARAPFFTVDPEDVTTLVGGGAYGAVYRATLHGQQVAAKTLHALRNPEMYGLTGPGSDPLAVSSVLAEFTKEAEMLAAVDHPHVLKFWGVCFGETNGVRLPKWIITELLPFSLHTFVRVPSIRETMRPWHVLCLAADMAEGLAYLHGLGIVHRDVKPKNVLVSPQGAKLSDLGTAKMVGIAGMTAQHTVGPGTAIYHPPEVLVGEYTESIDVFSLGLSVWEIATGHAPRRSGAADSFTVGCEDEDGNLSLENFVGQFAQQPDDPDHRADAIAVAWFVELTTKFDRSERLSAAQALSALVAGVAADTSAAQRELFVARGLGAATVQRMVQRRVAGAENGRGVEAAGSNLQMLEAFEEQAAAGELDLMGAEVVTRREASELLQQYTQRRVAVYCADYIVETRKQHAYQQEEAAATRAALAVALGRASAVRIVASADHHHVSSV